MTALRYRIPDALAEMPVARHHVVEASAGTGKTYLIEHRVLQLLAAGAPLESILVVTFTEKATAELRRRVRALIARALESTDHGAAADEPHIAIDERVTSRLRDALVSTDTAPIFTIHGFCQRVLTENAFFSRRMFEQTHVAAKTAFSGAFRGALREIFASDPAFAPYLRAYLESGHDVASLESLLFRAHEQRAEIRPRLDARALEAAARAAAAAVSAAGTGPGVEDKCRALKIHASTRKAIARRIDGLNEILAQCGDAPLELCAAFDAGARKQLREVLDRLPEGASADLDRLASALGDLEAELCPVEAAIAQALLPEIRTRLRREKDRRGELDFGDLLALVWEALEGEGGDALADRLRRRYRHALIDEFQDTDPTQWAIFRRLFLESPAAGSLAIIGDPKQAIYGFRGADVATYLRACREVRDAGGGVVRLPKNFRSTPAMVAAVNALVGEDDDGPFFTGGIRYDAPVTAARELRALRAGVPVPPAHVFRLRAEGDDKPDAETIRATLRRRIAAEIQALLGERPLFIDETGSRRRLTAGDIFVLTRTRPESDDIARELRRAGIPCALYQQAGLFASSEATEVFELLVGIAEPDRASARLRAWQTRFFDVPVAELPALTSLADTHPLIAPLWEWHALAADHRYEELFSAILMDSGVLERELFADTSERSFTNFVHIFEILLAEVNRSRGSLGELIQKLGAWRRAAAEGGQSADTDLQRLESEADAVQIMTVHKSKGLETGVVFLYGAASEPPADSICVYRDGQTRLAHVGSPLPGEVADAARAESRAENQRLLYVAVTRAAARLYLPLYPESKGTYAQLNERLARAAQRAADPERAPAEASAGPNPGQAPPPDSPIDSAPASPPHFEIEEVDLGTPGAPHTATPHGDPLAGWEPPAPLLDAPAPAPAVSEPSRAGFVMTSYTRMKASATHGEDERAASRGFVKDDPAAELAPDELSPGAASGTFLHEILEHLDIVTIREAADFETWRARDDVRELFDRTMHRHARDPRQRRHGERMIYEALTTPVAAIDMPRLADRQRDYRELEFLYPLPGDEERGYVKGFIDFVFEWRGQLFVLDWKSDLLPDYGPKAVASHAAAHYSLQADIYALALVKLLDIRDDRDFEARFGGVLYWFLRGAASDGSGMYVTRPSLGELRAAEHRLSATEAS